MMNNVTVHVVPHAAQRYPTCGDWYFDTDDNLIIKVSEMGDWRYHHLVAIHEYSEAVMCRANGVTQKQVDEFDMNYEANRKPDDESENGDHIEAPYYRQHQIATGNERILAQQMGVDWVEYEKAIGKLFE